ncbi:MAG TPA: site-specific integrase, partial [Terrimicrobiaceae bacterium]
MKTPSHVVASYPSITQLIETLSLQTKGRRTCEEYVRYVRKLAQHSGGDPALLDEVAIRAYLIYLREEKHYAPSSLRLAVAALRFFYTRVLERQWKLFDIVSVPDRQRLPTVLSREEVRRILG